ncbi:MAG: STAS domain-containing protein [Gemmatimonadota bacterium]
MTPQLGAPFVIAGRQPVSVAAAVGCGVLDLSGDLVVTSGGALRDAVEELLAGGVGTIVLGCSGLTHIDTPGLALLQRLAVRCGESDGALIAAGLPPAFHELTERLRLRETLQFAASVEAALAQHAR